MNSEDKLNLTKVFITGKLLEGTNGRVSVHTIKKNAKNIPFLNKYYEVDDKELRRAHEDKTTRDIIASINDLEGNRVYYQSTEDRDKYISLEERYGSKDDYQNEQFAQGINKAFRNSGNQDDEVKELLRAILEYIR